MTDTGARERAVRAGAAALCEDAQGAGIDRCATDCVCWEDARRAITAALPHLQGAEKDETVEQLKAQCWKLARLGDFEHLRPNSETFKLVMRLRNSPKPPVAIIAEERTK